MAQNNPPQPKKSLFSRGLSLLTLAGAMLFNSVTGTGKNHSDKNETDKEISIVSYADVKNSLIENEALAKTAKRIGIPKKKFANMKFGLAKCETPSIGKNFAVQGNPNSSAENLWQMVSKTYRDYGQMIGYSDSTLNASRLSTDSAALQVNNTIQMRAFEDNYRLAKNKIHKFREDGIDSLTVTGKKDKHGVLESRTIALDDDLAPLCLAFAYHAGAGNVDAQLDKGTKDSTGKKLTASLLLPKLGNQNFFPHFNVPFTYGGELDLIKPKKKRTVVTQVKSMPLPYSQDMVALSNALENHGGIDSDNVAVIKIQEPSITKQNPVLIENNNVHHYPSPPQEASENPVKDRSIATVSGGDVPCQTLGENDIQLQFVTNKKDVFSDAFKQKYMNQKMSIAGKEYDITEQFFANFGSVYGHASAMIFTNAYNRQSKNEIGKDALSDKTKLAKHLNALEENKIYPIYSNLSGFPSIG